MRKINEHNNSIPLKNLFFKSFILISMSCCFCSSFALPQVEVTTEKSLRSIANAVIDNATFKFIEEKSGKHFNRVKDASSNEILRPESPYTDWRYWNGVLNIAMLKLGDVLHEARYTEFSSKNIAFSFDNYKYFEEKYKGEGKWNYPFAQRFILEELDDCGAIGASVIEVYDTDPQQRYREYIDEVADHMLNKQTRLEDGTFVRSFPFKWTLWTDDLYMSISFLSRMGELTKDNKYFDDAARQVINFHNYLFDNEKKLTYHNWYSDVNHAGVAFWGRANGWAMLAEVDLLDRIPENHPKRDTLLVLLKQHILGIAQYQSSGGLWHQLLDKVDSYLETSCSAMFTYAIAHGVNKGFIDKRYSSISEKGWEGILSKIHPDGKIEGVCTGTVVSDNLVDYYNRPAPLNDIHGVGAVLLAGMEVLKLQK